MKWPRANSTAPAIPHPVDASTTAGGGTPRRASGSTTRCASGRKTLSHTHSCRRRALRERASLDKRPLADGFPRHDQLARSVDLVPDVPHEESTRPAVVVDIRDRPLAIRLVPGLDGREARVDLSDGLVAEVEHVGVEKRNVVVDLIRAGHVRAHDVP